MLRVRLQRRPGQESGQSLIETAIVLPFLLIIAFNAINFGYAFFTVINMAGALRTGAEYSIQGFDTPNQPDLPTATEVSVLTYADLATALAGGSTTPLQVCTMKLGVTIVSGKPVANCTTFNPSAPAFPTPPADPDGAPFVLHRVVVRYQPRPPIPGGVFNVLPTVALTRQVAMRAMN